MRRMCIDVRAGNVRNIHVEGFEIDDVQIEVRDYDVEGTSLLGEELSVDSNGEFVVVYDWGTTSLTPVFRVPDVRVADDLDHSLDQCARAKRLSAP